MKLLIIKTPSLKGPGIIRQVETGEETTIWKFRTMAGAYVYENADGVRFTSATAAAEARFNAQETKT